jgi:hypothetical protein
MTPEQTFGQLLGLGKSWRVVKSRFEPESSTFFLKVEETPELRPEESARAGTSVICHDHVEPMQWRHLNVFNVTVRPSLMVEGPNGRDCEAGGTLRLTAVRIVSPVVSNRARSPGTRGSCYFGRRLGPTVAPSARGQFPDLPLWMTR